MKRCRVKEWTARRSLRNRVALWHTRALHACAMMTTLCCISAMDAAAQWELSIRRVDAGAYPTVRMNVLLRQDGIPYSLADRASWSLLVESVPTAVEAICPDTSWVNSVAMILDNSGSMMGTAFENMRAGLHSFIDKLNAEDEAALFAFDRGASLKQDFTTNRTALHQACSQLSAAGSTYMCATMLAALRTVGERGGSRAIVAFSDGIDVAFPDSMAVFRALIAAYNVRVFIIGYGGLVGKNDDILRALALESGGRYYPTITASDISKAFLAIAADLQPPGCLLTWRAPGCTDSLLALQLQVIAENRLTTCDTTLAMPHRPDTTMLRVKGPGMLAARARGDVQILVSPRIDTRLRLSFRFLLHYDPALLRPCASLPASVPAMLPDGAVRMRVLQPGLLECSAENAVALREEGLLCAMPFEAMDADSSRPVALLLDSARFINGCDNVVLVHHDTVDICQCLMPLTSVLRSEGLASEHSAVRIQFRLPPRALARAGIYAAEVRHDPSALRFMRVTSSADSAIAWRETSPGLVLLCGRMHAKLEDSVLCTLEYGAYTYAGSSWSEVRLPRAKIYADCCYPLLAPDRAQALVDGYCDRIFERRQAASIGMPHPHPLRGSAFIPVFLEGTASGELHPARLELCDAFGRLSLVLFDGTLENGEHLFLLDATALPTGTYHCRLRVAGETIMRGITVLK